jgi:hypothetical protein
VRLPHLQASVGGSIKATIAASSTGNRGLGRHSHNHEIAA